MKVIEAVQAALLSSLKLADYDPDVVLEAEDPDTRIVFAGKSDNYAHIEIMMFSGRSKRRSPRYPGQ